MTVTTLKEQGPELGEADVAGLEATLGQPLPAPYRRFLLANNGGIPVPNTADVPGFAQTPTDVQEFFGLGLVNASSRIDWNIETLKQRLDDQLIPIACDSGGNVFCLSLRATDEGAVLYCDLDAVYADYGRAPPLYRVAADFEQFLGGLRLF